MPIFGSKSCSHQAFANMMLSVTKTDIKDAKLIALCSQRMQPELNQLPKTFPIEIET
jgi:hypothetical protein